MADQARIVDLAAAVAAKLVTDWAPVAPNAVTRCWLARICFDENRPDELISGRQVYVMPADPRLSPFTRAHWRNGYVVGVLLAERYAEQNDPPDSWIDARVEWWEQTILYPLSNPELVLIGPDGIVTAARPDPEVPPEVTAFVDREVLAEDKGLLICANFAFFDGSDFTGVG